MKIKIDHESRFASQLLAPIVRHLARRLCLWTAQGCAVLGLLVHPTHGAVTEAWVHRYSNVLSNSNDQAVKVVRDAAGDIIVTGSTDDGITEQDMLTIKYSGADGSVIWQKRSPGQAQAVAVDGSGSVVVVGNLDTLKYAAADGALLWENRSTNYAMAVAVDGSGNVVVTGYSQKGFPYLDYDYYTAKYAAADGALLWEKSYAGPGAWNDVATAIAVDGNGNVVVTGFSAEDLSGAYDYYTAKYAAGNGVLLWEKRYTDGGAFAVAVDGSDNVVVTGNSGTLKYAAANGALLWQKQTNGVYTSAVVVDSSGNVVATGFSFNGTNYNYYTAKYAAMTGALLWEQRYNGPGNGGDVAQAVSVDGDNNVVVTGHSIGSGSTNDYYTAKYAAADGALLWEQRYNGPANGDDQAQAVAMDGSGDVVVTGSSIGSGSSSDYYTAKYATANGALLWEKRYNGLSRHDDRAQAIAVDASGNVVVTGYSLGSGSSNDYYTAKYAAANGALLWERRYNGLATGDDQAQAVAVDGDGNVVVTGHSAMGDLSANYTAKYASADGALLWEKRYNGSASWLGFAWAVALDASGNAVVTGSSYDSGSAADFYTAKYAAGDGALLWEKRYDGHHFNDYARAVAVDGSGNVVVTGSLYTGCCNYESYTARYAARNGELLWEKRYLGPAGIDEAQAVAVDSSGNVVIAGYSWNGIPIGGGGGGNTDFYTAKYAAADGALLWEKRYIGPGNGNDSAAAVAVDSSGNVVVSGSSWNGTNYDFYTAKYAAADGALRWEKRYNGPGNDTDGASAVAVDGSGNVVVTGQSGNGTNFDYYTAKYAAPDGALLWEKRYNGPANSTDLVGNSRSLALGPNGMVAITGSSDGSFGSDYATVVYQEYLLTITAQPANQAVFTGSNAMFSVSATTTNPPMRYQWWFNTAELSRATNASLTITNVQVANAGDYQVVLTDSVGSTYSALASLSVIDAFPPPTVTTLGASYISTNSATLNGTVNPNDAWTSAHFEYGPTTSYGSNTPTVTVGNGGNPITMSVAATGLLTNTTYHFRLAASNSGGTNYGVDRAFVAEQLLAITAQPQNQAVLQGGSAVFTVSASSGFPLRYQWQFNATAIAGATNSTLTVTNVQAENLGDYTVIVANMFTSVTSVVAKLQWRIPPAIVQPPQSRTNVVGSDATFSVTVTNTAALPINYQWRKGSLVITNILLTDYRSSFTIYNVNTNDAATYRVVITNAATIPPGVTATATLTVVTDDVPPTVTLTSPTNGATFSGPADIPLTATVEDPDGFIAQVEFYAGANLLGTVGPPSYTLIWSNVPAGNYSLTARAFDNFAARSDSAPVNITVLSSRTPHIDTIHVNDGSTTLTWSAQAGRVYRVQYKTNLTDAAWSDLPGDVTGAGASASKTDPSLGNALQRFYRVGVQP